MTETTQFPTLNFLSHRRRQLERDRKVQSKTYALTTLVILVYLIIFVPILGFRFMKSQQVESLIGQVEETKTQITSLYSIEAKYSLIAQKLGITSAYMANRPSPKETLTKAVNVLPTNVSIQNVSFENEDHSVSITCLANDVFAVVDLIASVENALSVNSYQTIVLQTISRTDEGQYNITMQFNQS